MNRRAVGILMGAVTAVAIITVLVFAGEGNNLFMPFVAIPGTAMPSATPTYKATPSFTATNIPTSTPTSTPTTTMTSSATPSSTTTPTLTSSVTSTNTPTPPITATMTLSSPCGTQFEAPPVAGNTFVHVIGEVGAIVQVTDLTTGAILGADIFVAKPGHACPGFADFAPPKQLDPPLVGGHILLAENLNNGSFDTAIVLLPTPTPGPGTPSVTPTNTSTSTLTATPSPTLINTPTPSHTPPFTSTPTPSNTPTATQNPATNTPTTSPTPTATPSPNILFVVGDTTLSLADASVHTQLAALNALFPGDLSKVLVMDDAIVQTSDATGKDLVVISDSVAANNVGTKFRYVPVPVLLWESNLYDDMGMTAGVSQSGYALNQTQIVIIDGTHPLAASLSNGTYTVYHAVADLSWGSPGLYGTQIATLTTDGTKSVIFGYEVGDAMPTAPTTAPARRVGFMLRDVNLYTDVTAPGLLLFNAAVTWAAGW